MHVPDGWFDYSRFGSPIDSTRIVAVKTPLKKQFNTGMAANHSGDYSRILKGVPIEEEFTPGQMLELFKERGWRVGLVIDLTYTNRYYEPQDFIDHGVRHSKIKCPGQIIPPDDIYQRLCGELSEFLSDPNNDGSLVAVHCTHGLNRTGYLICRYLMEKCGYDSETAIEAFNSGRGCDIERENYLKHLRNGCPQDELRKSPARDRLGETDHLISGSLSSSAAHRGHLRWQSGGARRNDEEGDRRSREEVAREKRGRKRSISPIQWETGEPGSQTVVGRELYREQRRRDYGGEDDGREDDGRVSQGGPARKRAHYGDDDYRSFQTGVNRWDRPSHHTTPWRHTHHTQHSHDEAAPQYHVHDYYSTRRTDSWTSPASHYSRAPHYGGSHDDRALYENRGRRRERERTQKKRIPKK